MFLLLKCRFQVGCGSSRPACLTGSPAARSTSGGRSARRRWPFAATGDLDSSIWRSWCPRTCRRWSGGCRLLWCPGCAMSSPRRLAPGWRPVRWRRAIWLAWADCCWRATRHFGMTTSPLSPKPT